ncbi:hypothetical protein HLB44_26530 [Aquincola sp. S2]|uniref:Uncharacterized protein n=1 Tax=Pseudaquabacterium terrae TaxID=2732868 RepID=A0ABX2EPK1_9BURK|nr:hypothetical protein [Aquabacterium terrae]NRF70566.1 hypothetical protein [Aquabacterium terrae]
MNELFKLPASLPRLPGKIPMFHATRFDSMSSRNSKYSKARYGMTSAATSSPST